MWMNLEHVLSEGSPSQKTTWDSASANCPGEANPQGQRVDTRGPGAEGKHGMGSDRAGVQRFFLGAIKMFQNRWWLWLRESVNTLKTSEF